MAAYATVDDVAKRSSQLSADDRVRIKEFLEDAALYIDAEFPPSEEMSEREAQVRRLVSVNMVRRVIGVGDHNEGISSHMFVAGAFTKNVSYREGAGSLYMTKADRRLLASVVDVTAGGSGRLSNFSVLGDCHA